MGPSAPPHKIFDFAGTPGGSQSANGFMLSRLICCRLRRDDAGLRLAVAGMTSRANNMTVRFSAEWTPHRLMPMVPPQISNGGEVPATAGMTAEKDEMTRRRPRKAQGRTGKTASGVPEKS